MRIPRPKPDRRLRHVLLAVVAAINGLLLVAVMPAKTSAQAAGRFEVVGISHQTNGRLIAAVQASDSKLLAIGNVSVLVDGAQRSSRVVTPQERPPRPVVLAVETSGGMAGAPITAVKDALRQLVAGLAPRDPVALLGFSDKAEIRAPFGVDRAATLAALQSMNAVGGTALYQAVETASELASRGTARGMVILVSNGGDTGKSMGRDSTLRSVASRGIPLYVFGVGNAIDAPYLQSLASMSGGRYEAVVDFDALRRIFADFGEALGTGSNIEVAVPPLSIGTHSAFFRVGDKSPIEVTVPFEVTNAGMLTIAANPLTDPLAPIALKVTAPVQLSALNLKLFVRGERWPLSKTGDGMLDPWKLASGEADVEAVAANEGGIIARAPLKVVVPELKPVLIVKHEIAASGARLIINAHVQTAAQQSIVVRTADRELARTLDPLTEVAVPRNSKVLVELLAGEKVILTDTIQTSGLFAGLTTPVVAAMAALLTIGVPLVLRRKRSLDPSAAVTWALQPANIQPARHVAPVAAAAQAAEQMTNIIVRTPDGSVRRILVRRGAALTIGTDMSCDIRLTDDSVRSRHGLLTRLEDGHFELHPITGQPDEDARLSVVGRVLLRPGDPVRIGQHVLVIE